MAARFLGYLAAVSLVALPATAAVKVYDSTPPGGTPGDVIGFSTTMSPGINITPGNQFGNSAINDNGSGTVTLVGLANREGIFVDFDTTTVFGPGSFVFSVSDQTRMPSTGSTHPGSTAPAGTIDWGVVGGWTISGAAYCISSPQTICTAGAQVPHGTTVPAPSAPSPTYDLGTWVFDANGDYEAATAFIWATFNGGVANRQFLFRGSFVGGSVPAAPLIGVGALAVALTVAGARSLLRRR